MPFLPALTATFRFNDRAADTAQNNNQRAANVALLSQLSVIAKLVFKDAILKTRVQTSRGPVTFVAYVAVMPQFSRYSRFCKSPEPLKLLRC